MERSLIWLEMKEDKILLNRGGSKGDEEEDDARILGRRSSIDVVCDDIRTGLGLFCSNLSCFIHYRQGIFPSICNWAQICPI